MLRKLFVLAEVGTHQSPLYLIREGGNQQHVIEINGVNYTFGFSIAEAAIWTEKTDVETFVMVNAEQLAGIKSGTFVIQTIYRWYE